MKELTVHSIANALSFTHSGPTASLFTPLNPLPSHSSTSTGASIEVQFAACTHGSEITFTVNSCVSLMILVVSFHAFPSEDTENMIRGGSCVIIWNQLKGARFRVPLVLLVDTKATGLGTTPEVMSL